MNKEQQSDKTVVFWGTYDLGKPRVRLLLMAGKIAFQKVMECHCPVWTGVEDKSQMKGFQRKFLLLIKWIFSYPGLVYGYLKLPPHDYVVVPYMGQLDMLVIYPFAKIRGAKICWDIFVSLYDTTVIDRQLVKQKGILSKLLYSWEWLTLRLADILIIDTDEHARYIERLFSLRKNSIRTLLVGTETNIFTRCRQNTLARIKPSDRLRVLFYGQFIPLHGIDTIISAAEYLEKERKFVCEWTLIGKGQLQEEVDNLIKVKQLSSICRVEWVQYEALIDWLRKADICLGVFQNSGKALRVIPNKVYQILAAGRPLITADSPAIRELVTETSPWIKLVTPGDPIALGDAVIAMSDQLSIEIVDLEAFPIVDAGVLAQQLKTILQ